MLAGAVLRDAEQSGNAEFQSNVELIRTAANQMETLISDLLDVTRLEAGRLAVHHELVPANELVKGAIAMLKPLAAEKGIEIRTSLAKDAGEVMADESRIHQVLSNLIGNALKFTPPGGRVTVHTRAREDRVEFCVEDTGPGFPADQLPHIFQRYWQSRRTERHGAGLGLPIAKGIITAHGGSIHAESGEGGGTKLYFTLERE
jgi:signal transduction histidine kinase